MDRRCYAGKERGARSYRMSADEENGNSPREGSPLRLVILLLVGTLLALGCGIEDYDTPDGGGTFGNPPDEDRFERVVLGDGLDEPIELDILPDGRVIFIERYGDVHLYNPDRRETVLLAELDVKAVFSQGLLGVTIDPDFATNGWVYFYYSPTSAQREIQRLSRFRLRDNDLLLDTEQVILEIPVQRQFHAHDGGSLAFGPEGNLFVAVGDNVSPFMNNPRYPMDERPGKAPFDAQGTSLNTNDLNGKILRIRPDSAGGYTVPSGNLFSPDTPQTKPEIYVMGARNPYRLSVDPKMGTLYYGNMGGIDELHRVDEAGLYGGWPYFYGDREVYDHAKKLKEDSLDPGSPRNTSPNNTGLTELPPVQPAMLWYDKEDFPALIGDGGQAVMAGPVYYSDQYPDSPRKFPDYYNGQLFFYDWVRSWIMTVQFDGDDGIEKLEPFLPSLDLARPIDMAFGPGGAMYLLEYGSSGYAANPDARLSRVDYVRGNRPPDAAIVARPRAGAVPHTVHATAEGSFDSDGDSLRYEWRAPSSTSRQIRGTTATFNFDDPGEHAVIVVVRDPTGAADSARAQVKVGNEPPTVDIDVAGNRSFYWDDRVLDYGVRVREDEDGSLGNGIEASDVTVELTYRPHGSSMTATSTSDLGGRALIEKSGCHACHARENASVGPSLTAIAERYRSDPPVERLTDKVIEGGGGNWENSGQMPAHPSLTEQEVKKMVEYIVSIDEEHGGLARLPLDGTVPLDHHESNTARGRYVLRASYTDRGNGTIGPLTRSEELLLRRPTLEAEAYDRSANVAKRNMYVDRIRHGSYVVFDSIDVTGLSRVTYRLERKKVDGRIEVRLDGPAGRLVSTVNVDGTGQSGDWREELYTTSHRWTEVDASIDPTNGVHDLYFVFKNEAAGKEKLFNLDRIHFGRSQDSRWTER